jgi:glycosyltransferase involved in cell wall biosynthesis
MTGKVDIVVERQWHAPALACALLQEDRLGSVFTGFPRSRYTTHGIPPEKIRSHPLPAAWNLAVSKLGLPPYFRRNEPYALASSVAAARELSPVVTCLATSYQHLFPNLISRPVIRVVECGSMHPEENHLLQQVGRREAGMPSVDTLPPRITAECSAAKMAHFHVCGSRMIVESYVRRGYDPTRILHCPYGVDTTRFSFIQRQPAHARTLRIATVGVIGVRKGIVRLIRLSEWAQSVGIDMEIHLIGPIDADVEPLISRSHGRFVRRGVLKGESLVQALHEMDLYCLPSYEEGFGISIIEAMATGLPAIVSEQTGGKEAITDEVDGLVLSEFSGAEFLGRLKPWLDEPGRFVSAGSKAASKARERYSLEAYSKNVSLCYAAASELAARTKRGETVSCSYPELT